VTAGEPVIARAGPAGNPVPVQVDVTLIKTGKGLTSIKIRFGLFGEETRLITLLDRITAGI
jgi:hypothetical protein